MGGVSVSERGQFFTGDPAGDLKKSADDWTKTLAITGAADIRATQAATYRVQRPHARLQTEARPEAPGWKIWDQRLIYGPWLEGTGSRNRTTRFKGYFIWRRAVQKISQRAKNVGQPIVVRWMGKYQ